MDSRLIPEGIRDERTERLLSLLDGWDGLPVENTLVYRASAAETDLLRQLAWQFHVMGVEGWSLAVTTEQRRALVRRAMELHRYKGTPWAVRRALDALGLAAEIVEWFDVDDLAPYEFGIRATITAPLQPGVLLNADTADRLRPTIDAFKSIRSHLAWLAFAVRFDVPIAAPDVAGSRRVRRRTDLPVYILPTFDTWALDGNALDPRPITQSRVSRVTTAAAVQLGRKAHLDRMRAADGPVDGPSMDLWLPYREGERVPPLARVRSDTATRSTAPVIAADTVAALATRDRSRLMPHITPRRASRGFARASAAVARPIRRGLDVLPTLDATAMDAVPLDMPMETLNA